MRSQSGKPYSNKPTFSDKTALRIALIIVSALLLFILLLTFSSCSPQRPRRESAAELTVTAEPTVTPELTPRVLQLSRSLVERRADAIPDYAGELVVELEDGIPDFTEDDALLMQGEVYSPLDALGRCGVVYARLTPAMMPTEERGEIGMVKPSGWHTVTYPDLIADRYLYNRCHLIAYALSGENANDRNLITGTRQMNVSGMLPYENRVSRYLREEGGTVLYRVTPLFVGDELVARGVEMEACSLEDRGAGLSFHVFVYNVQDGIRIDYATGDSTAE